MPGKRPEGGALAPPARIASSGDRYPASERGERGEGRGERIEERGERREERGETLSVIR